MAVIILTRCYIYIRISQCSFYDIILLCVYIYMLYKVSCTDHIEYEFTLCHKFRVSVGLPLKPYTN